MNKQTEFPLLNTERLNLRPVSVKDSQFMLNVLNDPDFLRFVGDRNVRTDKQAIEYLGAAIEKNQINGDVLLVVTIAETEIPIGVCSLLKRPSLPAPDIGFAFLPDFRGQGYAFEATSATIDFAKSNLGLERLVAVTDPENKSSISLLNKLGMHFDSMVKFEGSSLDSCMYVNS